MEVLVISVLGGARETEREGVFRRDKGQSRRN